MSKNILTEEFGANLSPVKCQVMEYWEKNVTNWKIATAEQGSDEYFKQVESYRFSKLDYLPKRVNYSGYSGQSVLDVGCGLGTDLARFVSGGSKGTGIDLCSRAIDMARKNFAHRGLEAEFIQMDGEAMGFEDNSFDIIYCHTVYHFTPDPVKMMTEIHRVLKPGGTAIIMTINRLSWLYFMHRFAKMKIDYMDAPVFKKYSVAEFKKSLDVFSRVDLIVERFPVRTEVHKGVKALLYNTFFVDLYNAMPKSLIGNTGYHLLAFAHKIDTSH